MFVFNPSSSGMGTRNPNQEAPACLLVVEDEEQLRLLMTRALTQDGYLTLSASDGIEGLAILERESDRIDLVITDLVMPRLGGLGLYQAARRQNIAVPMLFTSAGAHQDAQTELPPDARLSFLRKPWTLEELGRAIRWALEDGAEDRP
jgi:two-component system cell cycle sensor histidine kinase/response regulator CckA